MEEKMDELLQSFTVFKRGSPGDVGKAATTGERNGSWTAQLMARKLKKTPEVHFKHKGNEKQFLFNDTVSKSIQTASGALERIKNVLPQEANLLKTTKEQLLEGTKAIRERQKLIRIVDSGRS